MTRDRALATLGEGPSRAVRRAHDDVEIPEPVLTALASHRPLIVLRAPRGYGKTAAIRSFLLRLADVPVVAVTLTARSHTTAGFWQELADALAQAELLCPQALADADDARAAVVMSLAEQPSPLVLVLDDYHEAGRTHGAAAIDDDLVEISRQNDHIDLVVATRAYRGIESVGLLSLDGIVIEPDDLRLTGPLVMRLAERMGVSLALAQAEQIVADTAGWPCLIRAGLARSARGQGRFDVRLVDDYIQRAIADLDIDQLLEFAVALAVPVDATIEVARRLLPADSTHDAATLVGQLHAGGLLHESVDGTERRYTYSPAARTALLRIGREVDLDTVRDVHRVLLGVAAETNDPVQAFTHAVEAGEFDIAADVLVREWGTLIAIAPTHVATMASKFPKHLLAVHPQVRIAANDLRFAPTVRVSARAAHVGATFASDIAERLRRWLDDDGDDSAVALMHWGVTNLLLGNLDGAVYAFNRARNFGLAGGGSDQTVEIADVGLAVCHGFEGQPALALRWLQDGALASRLAASDMVCGDIAVVGARVARLLALADQGHADAQGAATEMGDLDERDDVWAATVVARAHALVASGDVGLQSQVLNDVRAAMRHVAHGSVVELALANVLVELLVATDAIDVAVEISQRYARGPIGAAMQAKAALAAREYDQAMQFARQALDCPVRSWRTAAECRVIVAAAEHGLGLLDQAQDSFRRAVRAAQSTGQRRPFMFMQRFVFDALAADEPSAAGLWPGEPATAAHRSGPERSGLTTKEVEILRALERHPGPTGIGNELGLSANTVKTHLRAIYRKLGVSNRADALAAVSGLGRG